MVIMEPVMMPAEPIPAMARPNMKTGDEGAAPQIAEPTSKTTILIRNVRFKLKKL